MSKLRSVVACAWALVAPACWTTFTVDAGDGGSGGAGSGGEGMGGIDGSGGADGQAGQGGAAGSAGSGSGASSPVTELTLSADAFEMVQGGVLEVTVPGVLDNDAGDGLRVTAFASLEADLPSGLEPLTLAIAVNGAITFEPAPDYWGTFELSYTAMDDRGQEATAQVSIHVAPRLISLALLGSGFGGFVVDGSPGDGLGSDLAWTGDATDDGIDDFIVGAPDSASGDGRAFLVLGHENPTPFQVDSATSRVVTMIVDSNTDIQECLGTSVDGLGDVNGDAVPDLILGAPGCEPHSGAVYVVHGGSTLSGTRDLGLLTDDASSAAGYRLTGQGQDRVGQLVLGGTDLEADGVPDVIASSREQIGSYGSFALVGVLSSAPQVGGDLRAARDLFITVGQAGFTFPVDVSRLGDVDADGLEEVLVGNRSTFAALEVDVSGATPEWPAEMDDVPSGYSFGTSSLNGRVAGIGDFDGDGLPDVVACRCNLAMNGGCEAMQTCDLFLGSALGNSAPAAAWTIGNLSTAASPPDPAGGADLGDTAEDDFVIAHANGACLVWGRTALPPDDLDCDDLPDGAGVEFVAEPGFALTRAALVGDVNGDGAQDLAFASADGGGGAGRVYVLFGGALD